VTTDKLSDVYTNRPFGKVYDAIRRVEEYLQPVFEEAGVDPTQEQPQAYTSRKSVDRIAEMTKGGKTVREIAEAIGKSRMTVHRHIQKLRERGLLDA
jgi:DNA-binding NarL/FixJ family response regulator